MEKWEQCEVASDNWEHLCAAVQKSVKISLSSKFPTTSPFTEENYGATARAHETAELVEYTS